MTDYEGGTTTRLPRYDASTLQPIRVRHPLLNENGIVSSGYRSYNRRPIPLDLYNASRASQQWNQSPSPLAIDTSIPSAFPDPNGTTRILKTPYIQAAPDSPAQFVNEGVQTTMPTVPKFNWEERLFENHYIGIHRMVFLVRKFPALAGLIISIWILFGRKQTADFYLGQEEINQNTSLFVVMVVTLTGIVLGVQNHGNHQKAALQQTIARIGSSVISLIGEITAFVFGLIAIINLAKESETIPPDCYPKTCFSHNGRIVQSGIQLGITMLSFVLTVLAIFHGTRAVFQILYDRKVARRTYQRKELASYVNPLVTSKDTYF